MLVAMGESEYVCKCLCMYMFLFDVYMIVCIIATRNPCMWRGCESVCVCVCVCVCVLIDLTSTMAVSH